MDEKSLEKLEYVRIKEQLGTYAMSYAGRQRIQQLQPMTNRMQIERLQREGAEALAVVASRVSIPIPTMDGIEALLGRLDKGMPLSEADLTAMAQFLHSTIQLKRFMLRKVDLAPTVTSYAYGIDELEVLRDELNRCLPNGYLVDEASPALEKIRKQVRILEERRKRKVESVLQKYQKHLQDTIVTERGGGLALSVKRDSKRLVPGTVVDQSASGQTVFIVPTELSSIQQELDYERALEAAEVGLILDGLTGFIVAERQAIQGNIEIIGNYDFLFAKAKFARHVEGAPVSVNERGRIRIVGGRHPLLRPCVPLDCAIGNDYHVLLITGPNTGGKTITLKTIGLLTLMVQSGLLVPVAEGSEFAIFQDVLADIGDGQSIDQSLSTFSAHVKNVIGILGRASAKTLVLMDELATGTDPGEGIGLSIAVLEELAKRRTTVVATTHFNEIKQYAAMAPGFKNARMEFNVDTLEPLYRLRIGEAGNSYAFEIAQKLGMPAEIIARSREITGTEQGRRTHMVQLKPAAPRKHVAQPQEADDARAKPAAVTYQVGDRVWLHAQKRSGIVYSLPDERGNLVVVIKKRKVTVNQKRISLYLRKDELYPDATSYDLDIVLESKDVRKKRKVMGRRHTEGLTIEHPPHD